MFDRIGEKGEKSTGGDGPAWVRLAGKGTVARVGGLDGERLESGGDGTWP